MKFLNTKRDITLNNDNYNPEMNNGISRRNKLLIIFGTIYAIMVFSVCVAINAFAADEALDVINNLSIFIFGLIRAVGLIILGMGIVQVGLSLKSHDPSQRANGFLTLAGGVVITFAKEILDFIVG